MEAKRPCRSDTPTTDAHEAPAGPRLSQQHEPSEELLDRARVGWERFVASLQEPSDD
ncbi:hypothetical protein ACXNSR_26065 [Streptomyces sp. NC-S4]